MIIIVVLIDIIGLVLIARWMYKDARAREMNPWGWILLTCCLSPNFIGLVAYLLCRRKDTEISCRACEKTIYQSMNYCPWCGNTNEQRDQSLPSKPSNRLLVAGVVIMLVCTLIILGLCFFLPNALS